MSALTVPGIRHAEKPDERDADLGPGLTVKGEKHSLVVRGRQRAGAWAVLFGARIGRPDFPAPNIVYAANPDPSSSHDGSHGRRPFETIPPLCSRLTTYGVGDDVELAKAVQQLAGVVLICWEHKHIVNAILPALTAGQSLPNLPTEWDGAGFSRPPF